VRPSLAVIGCHVKVMKPARAHGRYVICARILA